MAISFITAESIFDTSHAILLDKLFTENANFTFRDNYSGMKYSKHLSGKKAAQPTEYINNCILGDRQNRNIIYYIQQRKRIISLSQFLYIVIVKHLEVDTTL